jgi:integrase
MSNIYNEEVKNRYLETYENEGTQTTIRNIFSKSATQEETLKKDLYNFSIDDLIDVFKNVSPKSLAVSMSAGRFIKSYISWCITNGYRDNNDNPLNGVDKEWYKNFVDRKLKIHYSFEEFIDLLEDKNMYNAQDKAFLFLMWEGVIGEQFSELRELKIPDIDFENKTIYVKERDQKVKVSDECIKFLEKTINEKTYYNYNPKTKDFNERGLLPSSYVFKTTKSPRSSEGQPVGMSMLYTRLHAFKEILNVDHLTPNALKQSGMLYQSYLIYLEEGKLGYDQLAKIGEKYNFSKLENNGYSYFNTYLMREFISSENLKDLYDVEVEISKR